ncbi:MAG: hypothetical protein K6E19_11400 [Lachnospiraceae bacterium]|nr:hypothetical protein [Lachnospiraceae bacterium]
MISHYNRILHDTEEAVIRVLRIQERDENHAFFGAFYDRNRMVQPKYALICMDHEIACYLNRDSRFYHDERIYKSIMSGLKYVRANQHADGLFDYVTCNFNSAPDTAFCIGIVMRHLDYLRLLSDKTAEETAMYNAINDIVHDGIYGLLEGGFHTPNHRWAIASRLCKGYALYGDEKLKDAAFEYLKEGIDCNEDGEFAEKSAGNYNAVNNEAMIMLSDSLKDDKYDSCAVRNLKLMFMYWEPDESIFTANSTRFDKDLIVYPTQYYDQYLEMGVKYNVPEFLAMANRIMEIVEEKRIAAPLVLIFFMLHPEFKELDIKDSYHQPEFKRYCKWSGIYRAHKGNYTYTIMGGKSNFLYFHDGTIKLAMKVAGSFCEHRAFISEEMEELADGTIHLHQTMKGWYYLPFPKDQLPDTSDWWQMENTTRRPKKWGPNMDIDVWVKEAEGGIDVRVKCVGVEGAPWRIEVAFSGIEFMQNEHLAMPVTGDEILVAKDGTLEAYNVSDSITVGPCFGAHRFTEGKEDSEAKTAGAATLYLTDYTEFDHTIQIRNKRDLEGF